MPFHGDQKVGQSLLYGPETRLKRFLVPFVPGRVQTYHLTLTTVLWSALIPPACYLARRQIDWLWAVSALIALQYLTDLLDGEIGRVRGTGLVKWGFYMDHFLDYLFLCSILTGYAVLLPQPYRVDMFYVVAIFGGYMVSSFLAFACTNQFRIAYLGLGPTEIRISFILLNTLLVFFGSVLLVRLLPYLIALGTFGLFLSVFRTQRELWRTDMRSRRMEPPSP
jgi:phosphatidylglycerophosphate synthase